MHTPPTGTGSSKIGAQRVASNIWSASLSHDPHLSPLGHSCVKRLHASGCCCRRVLRTERRRPPRPGRGSPDRRRPPTRTRCRRRSDRPCRRRVAGALRNRRVRLVTDVARTFDAQLVRRAVADWSLGGRAVARARRVHARRGRGARIRRRRHALADRRRHALAGRRRARRRRRRVGLSVVAPTRPAHATATRTTQRSDACQPL